MTDSRNDESAHGEAQQAQPQQPTYVQVTQPNNGLGVAGGVLGIVGLVLIWVPFLGGILCLLALIFGIIGTSRGRSQNLPTGMAVTGIVTGGVGTLIYVVVTMLFIIGAIAEPPSF